MLGRQIVLGTLGGALLSVAALYSPAALRSLESLGPLEALSSLELPASQLLPQGELTPSPEPHAANAGAPQHSAQSRSSSFGAAPHLVPGAARPTLVAGLEGAPAAAVPSTRAALSDFEEARAAARKLDVENAHSQDLAASQAQEQGQLADYKPSPTELSALEVLGALSKQTIIRKRPDPKAPIIGFARTGSLLRRAPVPAGHRSCKGGWYKVEPDGYVCVGTAATLDPEHPILQLASQPPDRSLAMPYIYGRSRYPTPPLYTKLPTQKQQAIAEQDLRGHRRKNFGSVWARQADTPPPSLMANGELIPRPYGYPILKHDFMTGRALGNSSFAFIDLFETKSDSDSAARHWGLTTDLNLIPLDRVTPIEASSFFGKELREGDTLPVVFVRKSGEQLFAAELVAPSAPADVAPVDVAPTDAAPTDAAAADAAPTDTAPLKASSLSVVRAIEYREAFSLTGRELRHGGSVFLETRDGQFVRQHDKLVRINAPKKLPKWAKGDRTWIDVSILRQTLVAYQGARPVFATLVSTGKDGLGDPEETHSTVQGIFLIHTKHVTATMSGNESDDEFDLRDVPYVQYFEGGYAFHAAYWHDSFGRPRSHGCINLSPADARHLFNFTEPPVPQRWHSALSLKGTLAYIHP